MRQNIAITVDAVIIADINNQLKVLLIKRKNEPFKELWALPGGFLEEDEELEAGAKRELKEETGLEVSSMEQIKTFGTLGRDPRGRTLSIAFLARIREEQEVNGADDAAEAKWFNLNELPKLAFDHLEILDSAKTLL
jgi:8-oxo-dGTP diphosphatase